VRKSLFKEIATNINVGNRYSVYVP